MKIISQFELSPEMQSACGSLEGDPNLYIETKDADEWVVSDRLILSRARTTGIANGILRMREASEGKLKRRVPISVSKAGNCYLVIDGNSTTIILHAIGVKSFPVKFVD